MSSSWLRPSAVSGTFYPREKKALTEMLERFCASDNPQKEKMTALVAPHAGYIYSGAIAGEVYKRVEVPATVILLCPNHTGMGKRVSVWSEGEWETPLGTVPINASLAARFLEAAGEGKGDREAHLYEHANEVHLPFLQFLRPDVSIVPITLGPLSLEHCLELGKALVATCKAAPAGEVLIVASTDMSHYISAEAAQKKDKSALEAIEKASANALYKVVIENEISMCGFVPTTTVLAAAPGLGIRGGKIRRYGNSGETSGDFGRVVAYAAVSFF